MKTGILGGTFDPPHCGHLEIARTVRSELDLDRVIFMVAGKPRLKHKPVLAGGRQRAEMVRLAIDGEQGLEMWDMELDRPGPTYTLDTLNQLEESTGDELYFILGWDNLEKLGSWYRPDKIIARCFLVAVPRPGSSRPDIAALEGDLPGLSQKLILLEGPLIDISATRIRNRLASGQSVQGMVPAGVYEYIVEKGLYSSGEQDISRA